MKRMTLHETIGRPVEEVFDYATEPRNRPEWQSSLKEVRGAPKEPGKGSTWQDVMSGPFGVATVEITGFERPHRYQESVTSGIIDGTVAVDAEGEDDRTRLTVTADLQMGGWVRYLRPILMPLMKSGFKRDLRSLREILESR